MDAYGPLDMVMAIDHSPLPRSPAPHSLPPFFPLELPFSFVLLFAVRVAQQRNKKGAKGDATRERERKERQGRRTLGQRTNVLGGSLRRVGTQTARRTVVSLCSQCTRCVCVLSTVAILWARERRGRAEGQEGHAQTTTRMWVGGVSVCCCGRVRFATDTTGEKRQSEIEQERAKESAALCCFFLTLPPPSFPFCSFMCSPFLGLHRMERPSVPGVGQCVDPEK